MTSVAAWPAFATLQRAYENRLAALETHADARAAGQPCVGYVGNTVPVELIVACGALPLRIAPITEPTEAADAHVESFSDPDVRRIFALYLQGALDALALLVIPRSSESWHKLYLALREAQRIGLKHGGPPLVLYEIVHTQRPSSHAYGLARTRDLAATLAKVTGRVADEASLRAAIAHANHTRSLLQQLQALRQQRRVSGWQAQVATGALRFMSPADGQAALRGWLSEPRFMAAAEAAPARARLFVQGVPLDHAALHAAVEAAGAVVLMEDDDWGSRAAAPLIDEAQEPLAALFEHHWRDVPNARIHPQPPGPEAFVAAHAQGLIDGVIFHLPRPDDVHGWQLPAWRAQAEAAGLPWLLLRDDARDATRQPALAQCLANFVQSLPPERTKAAPQAAAAHLLT